jgi:Raf kinase inhibitor-like YbhB/YbcL family protein
MKTSFRLLLLLALAWGDPCGALAKKAVSAKPGKGASAMSFTLSSTAFEPDQAIPAKHSCAGKDVSPELKWGEPPQGTQSFALVMDDPDAPAGTWVHWVVYNIPASCRALAESTAKTEKLPDGTLQGLGYGVNTFSRVGYYGPCPPSGTHHYFFKLYALDNILDLKPKATVLELKKAMEGHILGKAKLMGTFKR